ncbi:MAG: hypothetical protein WBH03_10770 [Cyclobacteriaceae bacterium]
MKKDKMKLQHFEVTSFTTKSQVKGGYSEACGSNDFCLTIHYTACYGNNACGRYTLNGDCN